MASRRFIVLVLVALCAACTPAVSHGPPADPAPRGGATADPWQRLVSESDSVGPITPNVAPSRWIPCGSGVEIPDSVQVSGGSEEFLFAQRSLRTRGYFSYLDPPALGVGRFALRHILCDAEQGRPRTFVLERDHRYFYLVFSLRAHPSYRALAFRSETGQWRPFRWDSDRRTFSAIQRF